MKIFLQEKLKSYSLFAGSVLATSSAATAQVMYTDVNPDVVLENTADTLPFFTSYALDLNNDGTADFDVILLSSSSSSTGQTLYAEGIDPRVSNSVAAKSNVQSFLLSRFELCDTIQQINPGATWFYSAQGFNYLSSSNGQAGWGAVNDFYVGMRIKINGAFHYGWTRFDINPDSSRKIVIKDYAFETSPNTPIVAGFCNVGIDELKTEFSIAPNPSDGKIFLSTKNILKGKTTVNVTDVTGRKVFTETVAHAYEDKISLDLTQVNSGVYFITLENENKSFTNKWIKL